MEYEVKQRADLVGRKGSVTREVEIIEAQEGCCGVDVRVRESASGDEYWTDIADIELD